MRAFLSFFISAIVLFSCASEPTTTQSASKEEQKVKPTPNKYTLLPFTPSPKFADAKIESMAYKAGKFSFGVTGDSYKLGAQTSDAKLKMCANSDKGQHIHLIVDNKPYAAKYTADFDYEIEDGEHHVLAFLSRSYHESIKSPGAAVVKKVEIKDNSIVSEENVEDPMLFYSRPKGTYVGKANTEKVMLDFYLANIKDVNKYRIRAVINGETHQLSQWMPYYIEGLELGENTIELSLLNNKGDVVKTPDTPVVRKFTLKADPTE